MWRELRRRVRERLPAPVGDALVRVRDRVRDGAYAVLGGAPALPPPEVAPRAAHPPMNAANYEQLYEAHARQLPPESSIGDGSFDLIGRIELAALRDAGLRPDAVLVDFGCGTGRLAVHAIPFLREGRYLGIDISESMLAGARDRVASLAAPARGVEFRHQTSEAFDLPDASVDALCAFSVFTHMEHEDSYRYLRSALRVVRPGGRLVLSCLPVNLAVARDIFLASAALPFEQRWSTVRNVTTSTELMEEVAKLAGWNVLRWVPGDAPEIRLDNGDRHALGQSILVLEKPAP